MTPEGTVKLTLITNMFRLLTENKHHISLPCVYQPHTSQASVPYGLRCDFLMADDLFSGTLDPSSTPEKQSCELLTLQIFWLANSCT